MRWEYMHTYICSWEICNEANVTSFILKESNMFYAAATSFAPHRDSQYMQHCSAYKKGKGVKTAIKVAGRWDCSSPKRLSHNICIYLYLYIKEKLIFLSCFHAITVGHQPLRLYKF